MIKSLAVVTAIEVAKITPPVWVIYLLMVKAALPTLVTIVTLMYTMTLLLHLLWKWRKEYVESKEKNNNKNKECKDAGQGRNL